MSNQILAGAVFHAGQVIAGVDADNPPYVGPPAHWAETQYGFYQSGGSTSDGYTSTSIVFNAPQGDASGVAILSEVDTKLTDNEVFKIEFRNSNKVVLSLQSPERIETGLSHLDNPPAYDDPEYNSHFGWRLSISSSGDLVGTDHEPSVGLNGSGVNYNDTTAPSPSIAPSADGALNNYNYGKYLSTDQIYFYDQAGEVVVSMDLSHTRTGNGFDADGSASEATSLTTLVFPPVPYLAFGVEDYNTNEGGVFLYDSRDISIEPIFLTEDRPSYSRLGGSVAVHGTTLVVGAKSDGSWQSGVTDWGSAYVYDLTDTSASPTVLKSGESLESYTAFGSTVSTNSSHIFVGEDRTNSGSGSNSGKVWAFDRNDLNATPIELAPAGLGAEDLFGGSNKLLSDDDIVVVSASGDDDGGSNSGAVYVFDASDLTAAPTKLSGTQSSESFGYNMAMNSTQLFISSVAWDVSSNDNTGKVTVYNKSNLSFVSTINMTGHKTGYDGFGYGVDATDDYVVIAAPFYDLNGQNATGKVFVYNTSNLSSPIGQLTPATVAGNNIGMDNGVFIDGTTLYVGNKKARHSDVGLSGAHTGQGKGAVYQYDINNLGAAPVVFNPQFIKDSTSRFGFGSDIFKDRS
jgi:hypothetical protein